MRGATNQAGKATNTAMDTGADLGQQAQGVESNLVPFETQQLLHPQGYSQEDQSAMLAAGLGGAGGATSGITGQANLAAARTGNAGGFQAALDDAARNRTKAAASTSEGIAAQNAQVKQTQQNNAAGILGDTSKMDQSGMLSAMGQVAPDINANVNANNSGWMQNLTGIIAALRGAGMTTSGGSSFSA